MISKAATSVLLCNFSKICG